MDMVSRITDDSHENFYVDAPILIDAAAPSATAASTATARSVDDEVTKSSASGTDAAIQANVANAVSNTNGETSSSRELQGGIEAGAPQLDPSQQPTQTQEEISTTTPEPEAEGVNSVPPSMSPGAEQEAEDGQTDEAANVKSNDAHAADASSPVSQDQPKEKQMIGEAKQPPQKETPTDAATNDKSIDPSFQHDADKFNVALESLEIMRKLNLEVEFSSASLALPVDHMRCTFCQREALHKFVTDPPKPPAANANTSPISIDRTGVNIGKVKLNGSRLRKLRSNVGGLFRKTPVANDAATSQSPPPAPPLAPPGGTNVKRIGSNGEDSMVSGNGDTASKNRRNILKKQPRPCLTCGHPTCSTHSSSTFFKNHIPICLPCSYLFELDFLVDIIMSTASDPKECRRKVDELVDCYDRAKLLLVFTAKYADEIASALETNTTRSNKIGVGSSATSIVSGITGVVGCGALLFPPVAAAGVPLLIASLVFGGGATAVQTGDAAAKFFSEPNRLAEKMVALHGMVLSLLRITEVLSYGLLKNMNVNYSVEGFSEDQKDGGEEDEARRQREALAKEIHELLAKHGVNTTQASVGGLQSAVVGGIVATEVVAAGAMAGAETTAAISAGAVVRGAGVVGRNTRYIGRVGTTAASGARFIPIAGGLLSAACVVVEGRELKRTLSRIGEGNPCEMAEQVRLIRDEVDMLPDSSLIAAECHRMFEMAQQQEKLRKKALVEREERAGRQGMSGKNLDLQDVDAADIADMISVMETSTAIDGMKDNADTN